jgi:hypothetical protein
MWRCISALLPALIVGLGTASAAETTSPQTDASSRAPSPAALSLSDLRAQRERQAWKRRRVIFNNDGNEPYWRPFIEANPTPSREALLRERTTGLVGSQVDAIFYCTNAGVGLFSHGTRLGNLRQLDNDGGRTLVRDYIEAGLDPLRVMTDFAHAHGMDLFWSFRMNDTHDGTLSAYGPRMFGENEFKKAHPEFLLGARPRPGETSRIEKMWSAVNYALPAVRDYVAQVVEEVCRNYDVDGIELDFFRHMAFFKSTADGKPATAEERAAMNDLMRRVRDLTEAQGLRRGRPFLIAVKIPDSVEFARDVGLDLETWLKRKWVDMLVPAGYFRLNPWEYSVALGHKYGVPVYPSLDDARIADPASAELRRASPLCYRGRAMDAWHSGADGIYVFNAFAVFRPDSAIWHELGDPTKLVVLDKDYFANDRGDGDKYGLDHHPYRDRSLSTLAPATREVLSVGKAVGVSFPMSDDFAVARQQGLMPKITLRLRFRGLSEPSHVGAALGGRALSALSQQDDWIAYDIDPTTLAIGRNEVFISALAPGPDKISLTDLQLQVRYEKAPP